jgi:transcriptional regulator with XRE-family HTH domain
MDTNAHEAVAAAIRAEMAVQRRSQVELAELLGLSQAGISRRMLGQTPIDVNELLAIAGFLGKEPTDFLIGAAA